MALSAVSAIVSSSPRALQNDMCRFESSHPRSANSGISGLDWRLGGDQTSAGSRYRTGITSSSEGTKLAAVVGVNGGDIWTVNSALPTSVVHGAFGFDRA